ncbi:MAG: acyl-ACP--UDP-N- acetylglucosamine O-acyltransferase [Campylobacterales bacterium]|nr:acyl-ACP--UDP-N- acetylglucosamine O-acyltransferase [Campylobacterales bacterium]
MSLPIHPTALIHPKARIAPDVRIGPFASIGEGVVLESGCVIEAHVILEGLLTCKAGVRIFSHTRIGNPNAKISIGEATQIREFCAIGVEDEAAEIDIAPHCFIMAYGRISGGIHIGEHTILTNAVVLEADVVLEERVIVGGLSTVAQGCRIGSGVMVGGASYITHDMPPFTLVEGNRAEVRGLNVVGLRRRLERRSDIELIKDAYKRIYRHGVDKAEAQRIEAQSENPFLKRFCAFIANSRF